MGRKKRIMCGCLLVSLELMAIDTVAPDTLSESGDWPIPGFSRDFQVLTIPNLPTNRGFLPSIYLHTMQGMQQFIKVNELNSCCCCGKPGRDGRNGATEGSQLVERGCGQQRAGSGEGSLN